jgi:hypothetical protein
MCAGLFDATHTTRIKMAIVSWRSLFLRFFHLPSLNEWAFRRGKLKLKGV